MATQTSLLTFTGKLGNVIGYRRNGRYFLRSMPQTVRQTTATRIDFAQRRVTGTDAAVIYIDPRQFFEGAALPVNVPGKGTLVITLQVRGFRDGAVLGERKYLAVSHRINGRNLSLHE
jgi:hypothetical protein